MEMKPKLSENGDWIGYTNYWRTYNRVLQRMGGNIYNEQIELTLSPINNDWARVGDVNIRRHRTADNPDDSYSHVIPDHIESELTTRFGQMKAWVMLHADLLPMIDWDKYTRLNNGGCKLADVLLDLEPKFYTQTVYGEPLEVVERNLEVFYHDSLVPRGVCDPCVDFLGGIDINGQYHRGLLWCWFDPRNECFYLKMGVAGYTAGMDFITISCTRSGVLGWMGQNVETMREFFQVLEEQFPVRYEMEKVMKEIDHFITYKYLVRDVL